LQEGKCLALPNPDFSGATTPQAHSTNSSGTLTDSRSQMSLRQLSKGLSLERSKRSGTKHTNQSSSPDWIGESFPPLIQDGPLVPTSATHVLTEEAVYTVYSGPDNYTGRIPLELVRHIVECLISGSGPALWLDQPIIATLRAISVVSKALQPEAERILYRDIVVSKGALLWAKAMTRTESASIFMTDPGADAEYQRFKEVCMARIGPHIRSLILSLPLPGSTGSSESPLEFVIRYVPNIKRLGFHGPHRWSFADIFGHRPHNIPSLEELELMHLSDPDDTFYYFLSANPQLKALDIFYMPEWIPDYTRDPLRLPNLECLATSVFSKDHARYFKTGQFKRLLIRDPPLDQARRIWSADCFSSIQHLQIIWSIGGNSGLEDLIDLFPNLVSVGEFMISHPRHYVR
jgi:hypothetical protein